MSEILTDIEQTELQISELKKQVDLRDRILRLQNNSDFRKVINELFLVQEAARFVQLSQDPALSKENQEDSLHIAQATGHLKRWLSISIRLGNTAEQGIRDAEQVLEELRAQGDAE